MCILKINCMLFICSLFILKSSDELFKEIDLENDS